jgi:hypothetical protein
MSERFPADQDRRHPKKKIGRHPKSDADAHSGFEVPVRLYEISGINARRRPLKAGLFNAVAGSVHGVVDEQDYNDGTQNNHPIGNLSASYRCFPLKPFHDFILG